MAAHIATIRFQPSKNPSLRLRGTPDVVTVSAIPPIGGLGALALDPAGIRTEEGNRLHIWIKSNLLLTDHGLAVNYALEIDSIISGQRRRFATYKKKKLLLQRYI
ncbi:hypothetical protein N7465_007029 [Penicillium sp. CMV-2018d]|nr:hypothetical protein N7465_007029 [Penicillium sp. CMV-2018d]